MRLKAGARLDGELDFSKLNPWEYVT